MIQNSIKKLMASHLLASALVLTACSGSSGSSSLASSALNGLVSTGAPVANANVTVKDSTGLTVNKTADSNGVYTFSSDELKGMTAPLLIQATGVVGGTDVTLHSLLDTMPSANNQQYLNVNPATQAITAQTLSADPATVFKDSNIPKTVDTTKLTAAKERLQNALTDVLTALGVEASKVDLMTTKFTADNTGLDKLFDLVNIQVNASSGNARDVVVAEKKDGGSSVTVSADSSKTVTKLTAPGNEAKLDIAAIKNFIPTFNRLVMTTTGIQSDEMKNLFATDFLDSGMSRDDLLADLAANVSDSFQLSDLLIKGCSSTPDKGDVCKGQFTSKSTKTNAVEILPMTFKLIDSQWRAYGNRAPFDFDLKPVATQDNTYSSASSSPTPVVTTGINLWFTGKVRKNGTETTLYKSATLWSNNTSTDDTKWALVMTLKTPPDNSPCFGSNFLPIDGGSTSIGCTNFKAISDAAVIQTGNAAQASGQKRFRIDAYDSTDATGPVKASYTGYSNRQLFTAETAAQAMLDVPTSITAGDLGTSAVKFNSGGVSLDSVSIGVYNNSTGSSNVRSNTSWNESKDIIALNGTASVTAANALCMGTSPTDSTKVSCNASYGSSAVVRRIELSSRDAQGRGIWKSYHLQNY